MIIDLDDLVLVTGATGFIGSRLLKRLLDLGFRNVRCFARPSSDISRIEALSRGSQGISVEVVRGNLLSREDCQAATKDVAVIFHLAAGVGEADFSEAYRNSVVTTRNLLEGCHLHRCLRRFVNTSSFSVYTNRQKQRWRLLDESCPVEEDPALRGDPYCFAKVKQDELVTEYCSKFALPYVLVRPGYVYGPGRDAMNQLVGIGTFGIFLHLGGSNTLPITYVDNCVEAIVLAGVKEGVDGEVFNVVDDDLPSSRQFLKRYKHEVRHFHSLYVPHAISYALCYLWERYATWSEGQLPNAFNRKRWHFCWKRTHYSNAKLKTQVGWVPIVPTAEGLRRCFESCRGGERDA